MKEPEFLPPDEYRCPACGHMKDTPEHELGCELGRREGIRAELETIPRDQHRRAIENVMQLDTLRRSAEERADLKQQLRQAQAELETERARYRELQEHDGAAIYRAHVMRGDRELDVAKLREELDAAVERGNATLLALWSLMAVARAEARRADRNLRLYLGGDG